MSDRVSWSNVFGFIGCIGCIGCVVITAIVGGKLEDNNVVTVRLADYRPVPKSMELNVMGSGTGQQQGVGGIPVLATSQSAAYARKIGAPDIIIDRQSEGAVGEKTDWKDDCFSAVVAEWPLPDGRRKLAAAPLRFPKIECPEIKKKSLEIINFVRPFIQVYEDTTVILILTINKHGFITTHTVERGDGVFVEALLKALRNAWIKPARINGEKVGGNYRFSYTYTPEPGLSIVSAEGIELR